MTPRQPWWRAAIALAALSCSGAPADAEPGDSALTTDDSPADDTATDSPGHDSADDSPADSPADDTAPLPWTDDPCAAVSLPTDPYADTLALWDARDDARPPPPGGLVIAGSSSIRRWEGAQALLSAHQPLQRGLGGAWLRELAVHAERVILRHDPDGVLVFAGTNDLAGGASVEDTLTAYRCLASKLHAARPGAPLLWIGVTPTPSRWEGWASAAALNAEVAALAAQHPSLVYVDVPAAFLATGEPPAAELFVEDQLHLSEAGYALWDSVVAPAVAAHVPEAPHPSSGLAPGRYVRVDLGPSNPEDGDRAPAVDGFGIHWNAWHEVDGEAQILAGEALRGLVDTQGQATGVDLVVSGGFRCNGRQNGGLASPSGERLGTLAVPEATVDYFYTGGADDPGALSLGGLDPAGRYTLRLFASRDASDARVTRYVVRGAGESEASLQTSGADIGGGNGGELVVLTGLAPDPWGWLHLDVEIEEGPYAYLSFLELEGE